MQRPAPATKRALFLTPQLPALDQGGGPMRTAGLVAYLERNYVVDIVTFTVRPHSKSTLAKVVRNASRLVRGRPPLFDRYSGYDDEIRASISAPHYDVGVVEHFWCASYADLLRPLCDRLIIDLHNVESQLARSHAAVVTEPAKIASFRFADMYISLEREWLPKYDTLLVASEEDRRRVSHDDIRVFPNAIPEVSAPSAMEGNAITFSGNLEYHPNVEAVRWFAGDIWPRIQAQLPDAEWHLVGRNPHAIEPIIHGVRNVRCIGPVDEAVESLAQGRVCVVPLLSGSGTRFKIVEAWAAQRAVVSTTIGAEGLGARDGEHILIADHAEEFAAAVVRLWNDASLRDRLGRAGRDLYLENFTWPAAWQKLDAQGPL